MKLAKKKRLYIYSKDIERMSGRSASYCRRLLALIRATFGKEKYQGVTVTEYCEYMNVSWEEIEAFL